MITLAIIIGIVVFFPTYVVWYHDRKDTARARFLAEAYPHVLPSHRERYHAHVTLGVHSHRPFITREEVP